MLDGFETARLIRLTLPVTALEVFLIRPVDTVAPFGSPVVKDTDNLHNTAKAIKMQSKRGKKVAGPQKDLPEWGGYYGRAIRPLLEQNRFVFRAGVDLAFTTRALFNLYGPAAAYRHDPFGSAASSTSPARQRPTGGTSAASAPLARPIDEPSSAT